MTDARLYALLEHLRANGVDVSPALHWDHDWFRWVGGIAKSLTDADAHAAIVVGCMNNMRDAGLETMPPLWDAQISEIIFCGDYEAATCARDRFPDTPHGWLLAVAHARGIAVPAELRKEAEGE